MDKTQGIIAEGKKNDAIHDDWPRMGHLTARCRVGSVSGLPERNQCKAWLGLGRCWLAH